MVIFTLNRWATFLAGVALFLMAIVGTADVVGSAMGVPLVGSYEIIETLMVITIFMAVAAAQQNNAHIRVELVTRLFSPRIQILFFVFGLVCSLVLFGLIAYFGWLATFRSFSTGEFRQGQLAFPVWPSRMALSLGATLMLIQCLNDIYVKLRQFRNFQST